MAKCTSKFFKRESEPTHNVFFGARYLSGGGVKLEARDGFQQNQKKLGTFAIHLDRAETLYLVQECLKHIHDQDALSIKRLAELSAK